MVNELANLTGQDTDGDLIPDDQEGYADSDNDGIPDYMDIISDCNVMPEQVLTQNGFLIEGEPGVCLRKGNTLANGETGGLQLTDTDLAKTVGEDEDAVNVGGIFDYIALGLPQAGQNYSLALPQRLPIPANAVYRKYNEQSGWSNFVEDENNQLYSTAGEPGYCPPPNDDSWVQGLTEGHWCVRLTIEDGGPNDNDGIANGTIVDPGGVAVLLSDNALPVANDDVVRVRQGQSLVIDVLANDSDADGDTLAISVVNATLGTVSVTQDNQLLYQADNAFIGSDKLVYGISDNQGGSASAVVAVEVYPNTPPMVLNETASTDDRTPVSVNVLANDKDTDNDKLTLVSAEADKGSVVIGESGTLIYTPDAGFNGSAMVTYHVSDGYDATAGQLTITVKAYQNIIVENESKGGGSMGYMVAVLAMFAVMRRKTKFSLGYKQLAILPLALMLSAPSQAQWFISGGLGHATADSAQPVSNVYDVISWDDSDTSYQWGLGYQFEQFNLIARYHDLGTGAASFQGDTLNASEFQNLVRDYAPKLVSGVSFASAYRYDISDNLYGTAALGAIAWQLDYASQANGNTSALEDDGVDLLVEFAVGYHVNKQLSVGVAATRYFVGLNDIDELALTLTYSF